MCVKLVNRIILGLLMLLPGLVKLFVAKPSGVTAMLDGFGFPIPMFFAWVLMLSEIVFGIAILANWKLKYTTWPPMIILLIAILVTLPWGDGKAFLMSIPTIMLHLVAITGFWLLGSKEMTYSKK